MFFLQKILIAMNKLNAVKDVDDIDSNDQTRVYNCKLKIGARITSIQLKQLNCRWQDRNLYWPYLITVL